MPQDKPLYTLYKCLCANNYDVPDNYASFERTLTEAGESGAKSRHTLYRALKSQNYDVPDTYERFYNTLFDVVNKTTSRAKPAPSSPSRPRPSAHAAPAGQRQRAIAGVKNTSDKIVGMVQQMAHQVESARPAPRKPKTPAKPLTAAQKQQMITAAQAAVGNVAAGNRRVANQIAFANANLGLQANPARLGQNGRVAVRGADGKVRKPQPAPIGMDLGVSYITELGNEYSDRSTADREQSALDAIRYNREHRREYLEAQKRRIEQEMNLRGKELDAEALDFSWRDMPRGNGGAVYTYNSSTANGRFADTRYMALSAQLSQVNDALGVLDEAEHGKASDAWINNSSNWFERKGKQLLGFGAGAWRGLAHAVGRVNTWDLGMTDLTTNAAMYNAVTNHDKGKATKEERDLLDLAAYAKGVRAENEKYIGYGYEAGEVTGESLPFMIETMLNPASGLGQTASNRIMRYAVKKYGKEAVKRATKKYMAAKIGTRVLGDVAGSAIMAGTSGQGRVHADALNRLTGDVKFKEDENGQIVYAGREGAEDSVVRAYMKAFGAQTIDNHSEMLGEYFAPLLGRAASVTRKGMERIGLGSVNRFIDDVGATNAARMLKDFEGRTKWNGTIGEYAEEVLGNVENALVVGDMTLDTNEQTGVFNKDQNIRTFLGVGLMGGFLSGVKTASYRGPKRQALNDMAAAGKAVDEAVAGNDKMREKWADWRIKLLVGSEEEKVSTLREVMDDEQLPMGFRMGVLNFSKAAQKYEGLVRAQKSKKEEGAQDAVDESYDESYDNGYDTTDPSAMHEAKVQLDAAREKLTKKLNGASTPEEANKIIDDPLEYIHAQRAAGASVEDLQEVVDYANAKSAFDGMLQRVRDDIDGRVDESDSMVDSRMNKDTGMITRATMKVGDRQVYVVDGIVAMYEDGSMVDVNNSSESILVRDAQTGKLEWASPHDILSVDEGVKPEEEKAAAAEAIRQEVAGNAAAQIDGVADGATAETQGPAAQSQPATEAPAANEAPVATAETQEGKPAYALNDEITLYNEKGEPVHGVVNAEENEDGLIEVYTDRPINGNRINLYSREELDRMAGNSGIQSSETEAAEPTDAQVGSSTEAGAVEPAVASTENEQPMVEPQPAAEEQPQVEAQSVVEGQPQVEAQPVGEGQAPIEAQPSEEVRPSALERVPKDEQGQPVYEMAEPGTAWDAIVEQTGGDEQMAQTVAESMVADKKAALKKAEKAKARQGGTIAEKIAAEQERKAAIEQAKAELAHWQNIAMTQQQRRSEAERTKAEEARKAAEEKAAEEARLKAEREETERKEREALDGVPDWTEDTAQNARARGFRRSNGGKYDRQGRVSALQGKEVEVKFADQARQKARVAVMEADALQPSHHNGQPNVLHFIPEAQPKKRTDEASVSSSENMARNINPEEITSSVTAYTGAPTVNSRGEVIQGNNRSAALKTMWQSHAEQAEKYKQYLMEHAEEFGLKAEDIARMETPVLVNMADVDDEKAIELGQYDVKDTESGGTERIKPKNAVMKMGGDMKTFAARLLSSSDEEASFSQLVDANGVDVLKWMSQKGFITPTQYKSAFDSKGNLTAEALNDLKGIMYQSIFQNGSERLEEMFNTLPTKAQRALLATAYRDFDSPESERMVPEIQQSIMAYHALMQDDAFANAKTMKEAQTAILMWQRQYQFDDATGESYLPTNKFSNFALQLAAMYKVQTQRLIQGTFNQMYDLIQGTQEADLFNQDTLDNTPRTLVEAIKEVLNIDYNGQQGSNVLGGRDATGQPGRQGSPGAAEADGRGEEGERPAEREGGVEATDDNSSKNESQAGQKSIGLGHDGRGRVEGVFGQRQGDLAETEKIKLSDEIDQNGRQFVLTSEGKLAFGEIGEDTGLTTAPILLSEGLITNPATNDGYGLAHIEARHGDQIRKAGYKSVVDFIETVAKNYDVIKEGNLRDGHQTYRLQLTDKHNNTLMIELSGDGTYWNINTAGIFKTSYGKKNKEVYSRHTTAKQPVEAAETSQDAEQRDTQASSSMNVPTSSNGKVTYKESTSQENDEKSLGGEEKTPLSAKINEASAEVNTEPTEAQKEAGNYKKGHVQVGTFDITIEQPQGSVRKGTDANGKQWESKMHNTYGYIRGTIGVDGDHIDVFLSNDIDGWNGRKVFVVDQYNPDGSFDEHKVMLGFNDADEAKSDYLANYEDGWEKGRRIDVTAVNLEDFEKWMGSSKRKTKPFSEYKNVKSESAESPKTEKRNSVSDNTTDTVGTAEGGKRNDTATPRNTVSDGKDTNNLDAKQEKTSLTDEEVVAITDAMKANATVAPTVEINDANWKESVDTPIGAVKMGENQKAKLFAKGREQQYGMLLETLSNPDVVLEEKDKEQNMFHERPSSYLFVKTFQKEDGSKYVHFESVTVSQKGMEVSISSHIIRENQLKNKLKSDRLLYKATALDAPANTSAEQPIVGGSLSSDGKDTEKDLSDQENGEKSVGTKLVKGAKWRATGVPEKYKARSKKRADSHGVVWTIGGKRYGSTVAERDLIETAIKEYGGYVEAWNAYERGEIILSENEAAILKASIEEIEKRRGGGQSPAAGKVRLQKDEGYSEFAAKHGVSADDVRQYAEGMALGNLALANQALASMRVAKRHEHRGPKLSEFAKIFSPIKKDLYERFGNMDELHQELVNRAEEKRNMMEAALRKAEETERKRLARLEELSLLDDAAVDERYMEALKKGDETAAREMLDEAARRKGYGDAESDYQGVGAWVAPSDPGYESDEARRNAVGEDSPDLNVEDMAAGYSNQPEDIFVYPDKYSQGLPTSKESGKAIQTAIDDIRNGKKDVKIKVYRAVPTSVKEGKLRNGDWVTPSKKYAEIHGDNRLDGKYRIIEDEVPAGELWWDSNDVNEWGYDNGKGYKYKNVKNNRKSDALVTRDDKGDVIPPSKRFNQRKADERYQRGVGGVKPTRAEVALRDAVIDRMRENGMEVITDVAEGQRVLDVANGRVTMTSPRNSNSSKQVELSAGTLVKPKGDNPNTNNSISAAKLLENVGMSYNSGEKVLDASKKRSADIREQRVWHGSGADFEAFDHGHMGSGEGAQAYGWGTYVTEVKGIGRAYAEAGIKYPADNLRGGREDGAKNYVIFNEHDAKITDHVRFFRTANGDAYGFTVGGKIYIDPRIATSETPVHEYAHLWAEALRNGNPKEWQNVVELMKGSKVWDEVKKRYPELKTDDEIADEVIATYSGRRGAERLREEQRKIADGNGGAFEKAEAISALERVKDALKKFWKGVADFLHIHYKNAEEVADRVMKDLLEGVDPRKMGETKDGGVRFSAKQKRALETASLVNATRSLTVVSSATGAKILNSIDKLVESLEESATQPKTFIGNVAKALGASRFGSGSEYATFETKNGDIVTIRLANHNAHVSGFDHNGKDNGISIVISPKPNEGITNDGNAHITEFYYDSIKLRRAEGKPLAEIVRSIKQALYSGEFKDTTGLAERQEVNGGDVIRYQFIGEKGAAAADHAEEVSIRLDNLSVAREMEAEKKDAKVIKMATGWERGTDGKWRYEIADMKYFGKGDAGYQKAREKQPWSKELDGLSDRIFDGEELSESEHQRFDELAQNEDDFKTDYLNREKPHLADWVENDELFNAYPDLKRVKMVFTDQMPANVGGSYNEREHTIVVNTNYVGDIASVLAHEVQHAIQHIEGFARGGSVERMKSDFLEAKAEWAARAYAHELEETAKALGEDYNQLAVEQALIKEYEDMDMSDWLPDKDTRIKGFNYFARGYADRSLDDAIKRFRLSESTRDNFDPYVEYRRLAGEVEARNVEKRRDMSAEERRASLAAETEDVAREDQIFLMRDGVLRDGDGAYSDEDLSLANDPSSKLLGESRYSATQRQAFAARTRKNMADHARELAKRLHLDNVEVVTDASTLSGRRQKAKGFYNKRTGKITIVVGNHLDLADVEQTVLHEAVAHYGLRKLFGEHFDTFLDNVFMHADLPIRQRITELARRHGWDFRTATEEYLANLAEDTDFEHLSSGFYGWWSYVKDAFLSMLHKIGFREYDGPSLSDNELRYILWRSYENLKEPGRFRSILGEAEDVTRQSKLKVGNYAERRETDESHAAEPLGSMPVKEDVNEINQKFNDELQKQLDGTLPSNHIYKMGRPGSVLLSTGVPDLPIQMSASRLKTKTTSYGHDFDLGEVKDLVKALQNPLAVFSYGDKTKAQNIIVPLQKDGKNFIVDLSLNPTVGGRSLEINSIRNVFPKNNSEWLNWIAQGKALFLDKEKIQTLIDQQRTILADVTYLDLDSVAKVVKDFVNPKVSDENVADEDVLFRDGDDVEYEKAQARMMYERRVRSGLYQTQEAMLDSMLGLKEAMSSVLKAEKRYTGKIEDVAGFENAYLGENRLSSVNQAECEAFTRLLFNPLLKEISKLASDAAERADLTDYMMAKHGLERNRVMAERDAKKAFDEYQKEHPKGTKTLQDFIDANRKRDYAGLTALTGIPEVDDAEVEAQEMVDEYEQDHDTTELWDKVNAATKATLQKSYESGFLNKATYDSIRSMYDYYIPLRGFDEKTSDEVYAYLSEKHSAFNAPIKTARGRKSKADDPLANMMTMAESAIMQGNRNVLVKQRFLNFVLNHPSDLVSVSDLWLRYDDVTGEWHPVNTGDVAGTERIEEDDSPSEVARKMEDFEQTMSQLAESDPDHFVRQKEHPSIPYRVVESRDLRQHQVLVKRNGKDYILTINGNPRADQALNGQTNPDNDVSGSIGKLLGVVGDVNRTLSMLYTTLQPDFVASNFLRDTLYANTMVWAKEPPRYAARFNKNYALTKRVMHLLGKYRKGTLNMGNETEKMFYQFMKHGGETGFFRMADIDQHKEEVERVLKGLNEKIPARKIRKYLTEWIGEIGRGIEMRARFAAFITSRQEGRSIDRSVWDAKEISVNFNKKGAGDKFLGENGQTRIGNAAAGISGLGRGMFIFWNAALQGTFGNFGKYATRHPGKMAAVAATNFALGLLVSALASAGGGDDDDSYFDLPEHTRRQNLILRGPGKTWIKIPLPMEYRAIYGMGELAGSTILHNEPLEAGKLAGQVSQLLPVDLMEGFGGLWPSSVKPAWETYKNETWYGRPIWKETPFNAPAPQWTKAFSSTNPDLVNLASTLNEASGGSDYKKGSIDLNPAAIEYLMKQYTGGFFTVVNQLRNLASVSLGKKDFDWRYVPLANRVLMTGGDERNANQGLNEKFFNYMDIYKAKEFEVSAITNDMSLSFDQRAALIGEIATDADYIVLRRASAQYESLYEAYRIAKDRGDQAEQNRLGLKIKELKRSLVKEMEGEKTGSNNK